MIRAVAIAWAVIATPAFAECEKVEFAELNAKNKNNLELHYCMSKHEEEAFNARHKIYLGATYTQDDRKIKAAADGAARCASEANRALEVLSARFKAKGPPKCAGSGK